MRVVADDRERASGVVEALRAMKGIEVGTERLTLGDALVDDRTLFARKTAADFAGCGVRREAFQGVIITRTVLWSLPLLRARDAAETARGIRDTGEQILRSTRGEILRPGDRPKEKRKRQLLLLQNLPGIGRKRAERLFFGWRHA